MPLPDFSVFALPNFARYWFARLMLVLANQIQVTTLGWLIYDLARDSGRSVEEGAFLLGLVGLFQFGPLLALALVGGQVADRFDRRLILLVSVVVKAGVALLLLGAAALPPDAAIVAILATSAVLGAVNAFQPAAASALLANLVPRGVLPQAIAFSSLAFTSGSVAGPAIGGLLYGFGGPDLAFGTSAVLLLGAFGALFTLRPPPQAAAPEGNALALIREGLGFVRGNPIVLGALSLDLVVVFLAGAQALLPVFARDVLHAGPEGLGILRGASAFGAGAVALVLAGAPLRRRVGRWMFGCVGVFGLATIVFGLSTSFWLTVAALACAGAADMVSVNVRQSLIQLATPDAMRGRVSSISFVFISASNELGDFEAGLAARFLGASASVAAGGAASLVATGAWIRLFPELWRVDSFEDAMRFARSEGSAETSPSR